MLMRQRAMQQQQGAPGPQPQGNMLALTRPGQALSAMQSAGPMAKGGSVEDIRAKAQRMLDATRKLKHKYAPGQHVVSEWSARNGHPPFTILSRTNVAGKPGYRVRHAIDDDNIHEYDLPESSIKGAIGD
jgi:hypothetical protein